MKKYIKTLISVCFTLTIIFSCQDSYLDEEILDKYAPESLNDKLGYEAAMVGLHNHFSSFMRTTDDQTILGMFQLGTDIVWAPAGRSNGNGRPYFDYAQLTPADEASRKLWRYLYRLIHNSNVLILNAEGDLVSGMTREQQDVYSAEARFFRAYAYNMLATLYGGVPIITEPLLSSPKTNFERASLEAVNSQIEEDLQFAIDNLPEIGEAAYEGRVNKYAAHQLMAEFYLRTGRDADAEDQCDAIIESGKFSLVKARYGVKANQPGDPFSDMFFFGNQRRSQGNSEAIWVVEMENPADVPTGDLNFPQQRRIWGAAYHDIPGMVPADSLGGRGLTRMRLNNWVVYELYDDADMRNSRFSIRRQLYFNNPDPKYAPVYGLPVPYGVDAEFVLDEDESVKVFAADTVYKYVPYTLKWGHFDPRDTFGYGMWKDFIMMRLGETYLLRAEARFKQGNTGGAADDIRELRIRANAPLVDAGDITLDFILDERARELLAEENRRMTLVRTGRLVERAQTLNGTAPLAGGNIETTNGLTQTHVLLPIPQSEIDLNKDAVLEQNPGYK